MNTPSANLAKIWATADEIGKLALLLNISNIHQPLAAVDVQEKPEDLDRLAFKMGLACIWVPGEDLNGYPALTPGVVSARYASRYRARAMSQQATTRR